jgi:Phytanoyl-CoA dioxygenase (PhyH)
LIIIMRSRVLSSVRSVAKSLARRIPRAATLAEYAHFRLTHLESASRRAGADAGLMREVREHGFVVVEDYWSPAECARCIEDFEEIVRNQKKYVQEYSDLRVFGAEELSDNIRRFAEDRRLADFSDRYNAAPTVNAFTLANKVEARPGCRGSGEGWHKDSSFRQFKALLYLDRVDEENGPVQLIHQSHTLGSYLADMRSGPLEFRNLRISDDQIARILAQSPSRLRTLTGGPGTLILVDTASIHRGCPPRGGVRYALTNYYVERRQIDARFVEAFAPVSPEKVWRLRDAPAERRLP